MAKRSGNIWYTTWLARRRVKASIAGVFMTDEQSLAARLVGSGQMEP
jgi:hypothetical protein